MLKNKTLRVLTLGSILLGGIWNSAEAANDRFWHLSDGSAVTSPFTASQDTTVFLSASTTAGSVDLPAYTFNVNDGVTLRLEMGHESGSASTFAATVANPQTCNLGKRSVLKVTQYFPSNVNDDVINLRVNGGLGNTPDFVALILDIQSSALQADLTLDGSTSFTGMMDIINMAGVLALPTTFSPNLSLMRNVTLPTQAVTLSGNLYGDGVLTLGGTTTFTGKGVKRGKRNDSIVVAGTSALTFADPSVFSSGAHTPLGTGTIAYSGAKAAVLPCMSLVLGTARTINGGQGLTVSAVVVDSPVAVNMDGILTLNNFIQTTSATTAATLAAGSNVRIKKGTWAAGATTPDTTNAGLKIG